MAATIAGVLLAGLTASPSAIAAIGPDSYGYTADNVPYTFDDISTTGTQILANTDDDPMELPLPFVFDFYGTSYTSVFVTPNGELSFTSGDVSYTNGPLNSIAPYTMIAPLWDDLATADYLGADALYYSSSGEPGSRTFVVQWNLVAAYPFAGKTVTFEAVLYEGSSDIEFRYLDTVVGIPGLDNGGSATVGIRDADAATSGEYLSGPSTSR